MVWNPLQGIGLKAKLRRAAEQAETQTAEASAAIDDPRREKLPRTAIEAEIALMDLNPELAQNPTLKSQRIVELILEANRLDHEQADEGGNRSFNNINSATQGLYFLSKFYTGKNDGSGVPHEALYQIIRHVTPPAALYIDSPEVLTKGVATDIELIDEQQQNRTPEQIAALRQQALAEWHRHYPEAFLAQQQATQGAEMYAAAA